MNTNSSGDPLDRVLHQWVRQRQPQPHELDELQQRIRLALVADSERPTPLGSDTNVLPLSDAGQTRSDLSQTFECPTALIPRSTDRHRAAAAGFLVGITLSAMIAFVWAAQPDRSHTPQSFAAGNSQPSLPDYARLSDNQLRNSEVLHSELQELFGHQLTWLAETDERVEVGLNDRRTTDDSTSSENAAAPVIVRVVIEKRDAEHQDWELAWKVDVVSKSEELVELTPESGGRASVKLWTYAMPDGLFAVDSELAYTATQSSQRLAPEHPPESESFRSEFFNVQQDRLPVETRLTGSDGIQYRVLQTVAFLNSRVG